MAERRRGAAVWIATVGGAGYIPVAPGTAGSAVGVAIVAAVGASPWAGIRQQEAIAALALGLGALGVWAAGQAEKYFGKTDPGQVVIDEVVGQMITLMLWPAASWKWLLAGFLLFRFFDVLKPFPARRLEHAPGGWGIMLDDVAAGIYGALALLLFGWLRTMI